MEFIIIILISGHWIQAQNRKIIIKNKSWQKNLKTSGNVNRNLQFSFYLCTECSKLLFWGDFSLGLSLWVHIK